MLSRRHFTQLSSFAAASLLLDYRAAPDPTPGHTLEIAPFTLEASPKHHIRTVAYNGQIPGPLLRMKQGRPQTVLIRNLTSDPEVVHWHGLHLPSGVDGAMEEGTPMIASGASTTLTLTPDPPGFRWFHTHTFAGKNLAKGQYSGQHGFLLIDPANPEPTPYDREVFLALHDWAGHMMGGGDGFMMPAYDIATINGKMLGSGEPIRVKSGERILFHILTSRPTEVHWPALAGHRFRVIALDGNPVPTPQTVPMLRLAPAERVSAIVEMSSPGTWILGEVRKHIQESGMGIVIEYANSTSKPLWNQPADLLWAYETFATQAPAPPEPSTRIELAFDAKFQGHGSEELWLINGKSFPHTDSPILKSGERYRLILKNLSADDHPLHLHRHTFEVRRVTGSPELSGLHKDVLLVPANSTAEIEFTANNPGPTLFHCHQQDHMDRGFMMVFRYA